MMIAAISGPWPNGCHGGRSETPWHLTRFQPAYRFSGLAETPAATLVDAAQIAREVGLRHVYVGNAPEVEASTTICSRCGERLIGRSTSRSRSGI